MRLFKIGASTIEARVRTAVDEAESHGEYSVFELGRVTKIDDTNYVSSIGVAGRHDYVSKAARASHRRACEERKQKKDKDSDD